MSESLEIMSRDVRPLAVERQQPSVGDMLQAVIDKGITGESAGAMERLVALYERMEDKRAEREFAAAFNALQGEMPNIKATSVIPQNDGSVRSKFAPYEEIMAQVAPLLQKHGFTVQFSTDYKEGRLVKTCTLQHVGGHSRSNTFAVRVGSGPPKSSEAQGDGAASTYAKRFALCDALNIVVDKDVDGDPRATGTRITKEQAKDIEMRVGALYGDKHPEKKEAFLQWAGATTYAEIMSSRLADIEAYLSKYEVKK